LTWYRRHARALPWRETRDPWAILLSEVMLQQTRVATVTPYYERFLRRFPTPQSMAQADQAEVLALWAGLGYYSRARNLQRAAAASAAQGGVPRTFAGLRALPGVGEYTAAAVASIAFGLPHAVVDGNVRRVLTRLRADAELDVPALAAQLLAPRQAGDFNQALMELGATVCLPRNPDCGHCPWRAECEARRLGAQTAFPPKRKQAAPREVSLEVLWIERHGQVLLRQRRPQEAQLAGFWELPVRAHLPQARVTGEAVTLRHSITDRNFRVLVFPATIDRIPRNLRWHPLHSWASLPVSTITRKAQKMLNLEVTL
jgi:A/G-specific adenine glycosylase